jgi:hypothetical protein
VAENGIDPAILLDAIDTFTETKPKGGVRNIARQIEDRIADGLIEAKADGARQVRFESVGNRVQVIPVADDEIEEHARPARVLHATAG